MEQIPDCIEKRLRQPMPEGCCVVPYSTPVIAFGDYRTARVATLSINPSGKEFLDNNGDLLVGKKARLISLEDLGRKSLVEASQEELMQILEGCRKYFDVCKNPYWSWFCHLEIVLNKTGASFKNQSTSDSACHLDLFQWATNPAFTELKKLNTNTALQLLVQDKWFMQAFLQECSHLQLLLLNGATVVKEFKGSYRDNLSLWEEKIIQIEAKPVRFITGILFKRVKVIGWNPYLQQHVTKNAKLRIGEIVSNYDKTGEIF